MDWQRTLDCSQHAASPVGASRRASKRKVQSSRARSSRLGRPRAPLSPAVAVRRAPFAPCRQERRVCLRVRGVPSERLPYRVTRPRPRPRLSFPLLSLQPIPSHPSLPSHTAMSLALADQRPIPVRRGLHAFYAKPTTQVVMVALCCFACPGPSRVSLPRSAAPG